MLFLITGGTIDKQAVYLPDGTTFDNTSKFFGETHVPEMLEKACFGDVYAIKTLCLLDSFDITDEHRQQMSLELERSDESQVVITHGTDTMADTARYLKQNEQLASKTIVLTGAMLPYSMGEKSDAMFNLGSAVAYAQSLPAGVYVAMNGQAFAASNVYKDVTAGVFKPIRDV